MRHTVSSMLDHLPQRLVGWGLLLVCVASRPVEAAVDHAPWDGLLHRHVVNGLVDYDSVAMERAVLDGYLAALAQATPGSLSRSEQLAFWINAYNACVFKGVLDHRPIKSVKDVKGFFEGLTYSVGGRTLTLNQIEAKGRALGDWRIHFGVVCASSSCPPLRGEAYVADRLQAQLTEQAKQFLNDSQRGVWVVVNSARAPEAVSLWVSKIFKWYAKDFVPTRALHAQDLIPVISPYLELGQLKAIQDMPPGQLPPELEFLDYDWTLNDQAQQRRGQ